MNTTPRLATPNTRLAPRSPRVRIPAATVVSLVFALVISWFLPWAILGGQTSLSGVAWLAGAAALSLALLFSRWHQPHIDDRDLDLILAALLGLGGLWLVGAHGLTGESAAVVGGLFASAGWLFFTLGTRATVRLWPAALPVLARLVPGLDTAVIASVGAACCLLLGVMVLSWRGWAAAEQLVPIAWGRYLASLAYLIPVIGIARVVA